MEKLFRCKDIGNRCGYEVWGESEEEVLQKATEHNKAAHHIKENTRLAEKVRIAIRTK
jgi:predicted small metal-binding protein